jgi:hypothetical protein
MPPPTGTWKNLERWVAKFFGGERTHWALEDDRAGPFSFECKHGKQIPKTILKWWAQAETNAGERVPLLVLHPPRWKMENSLIVLNVNTFREILRGKIEWDDRTKEEHEKL